MSDKLSISYHTAKRILLELLENNDFSTDEDILKILGSVMRKETSETNASDEKISRMIIDREGRIFLPDYSSSEIKIQYLPKTVFIFFLIHEGGVEFKSMYNYTQELYEIYQLVALEKNIEAGSIKVSLENLVEPVNNRIYEICSIIRRNLSKVVPVALMDVYCITGKRGGKHQILLNRLLVDIENERLKEMFEMGKHH